MSAALLVPVARCSPRGEGSGQGPQDPASRVLLGTQRFAEPGKGSEKQLCGVAVTAGGRALPGPGVLPRGAGGGDGRTPQKASCLPVTRSLSRGDPSAPLALRAG